MDIRAYIDGLAAKGRYYFTLSEAIAAQSSSPAAMRAAIRRLCKQGHLAVPLSGFILIVPPEYRSLGCLPADQFVPQLMAHLKEKYYAGLLTAANLHGAAHQAPMVFQAVIAGKRREIRCGRVRVEFITRNNVAQIPTVQKNTPRGVLRVSSPEATAFDLVGYPGHAGGFSNVATVLSELAEHLDGQKLLAETRHAPLPWAQRLGYLLELVGATNLEAPLFTYVKAHVKEYVPLRVGKPTSRAQKNSRWRLILNEKVELDL